MQLNALGIDGGFAFIGWTLMTIGPTEEDDVVINMGKFETKKSDKKRKVRVASDDQRRGREIATFFHDLIDKNAVSIICVEEKSLPRNSATATKLGHFFGIVSALSVVHDLPVTTVTPQELKKHATGRIKVDDEVLNAAILSRYPEADFFVNKIVKSKRQHAYDSLGAIDACKVGEVFRTFRSVLRGTA